MQDQRQRELAGVAASRLPLFAQSRLQQVNARGRLNAADITDCDRYIPAVAFAVSESVHGYGVESSREMIVSVPAVVLPFDA